LTCIADCIEYRSMKRNNDLVLRILLELEHSKNPMSLSVSQFADFPDLTREGLAVHVAWLEEHNLIESDGPHAYKITWSGDDFIGYSSDITLWKAATQVAGHLSFDAFYTVLKDLMLWKARKVAEEFFQKAERKQK